MTKSSKSIQYSLILLLSGFALFFFLSELQSNKANLLHAENCSVTRVEIPAKLKDRQEQIITHIGYTVSYNAHWKIPNWVAYELTKEEVSGSMSRSDRFVPDPSVPYRSSATTDDYKYSGWDRGHMAPAGDMKWSEQAMRESFYLSNVCPQNRNLNAGIWNDLEIHVRRLAAQKGSIYVVCGPIVSKQPKTIGANKVAIPDAFFKVLLQHHRGEWCAIAFVFPNESGRKLLSTYAMSVDEVQTITGIDFFPTLPYAVQASIKSKVDFTKWNIQVSK